MSLRKFILLVLLGYCLVQPGYSQTQTMEIRAIATVMDNLQMITIRDLDLISPAIENNEIRVNPNSSTYAGLFKILGTPNANIKITYLLNETLQDANGSGGVVNARYALSATGEDNQVQSQLLTPGEATIALSSNGELFVWLGATLDVSQAGPGEYISQFIIELDYI